MPEWDAQEYSCASVQTTDPYRGGLLFYILAKFVNVTIQFFIGVGYRPSFNAEMYGNAVAISKIAQLNNDQATAQLFQEKANTIKDAMVDRLWDSERNFFYHAHR